ncbi:hypothetical protein BD410DRAFT_813380 [Rickenella mellea]|uniref:dolichol kinase n=1 Tax=Rickenella mellea TaxID=50990 RepID=A0A4Y7QFI0_9AGAM|nr:hypothetical protein BD410DRAFT_813380 [Rickenella mellea]
MQRLWSVSDHDAWIAIELTTLIITSIIYLIWTHLAYFSLPKSQNISRPTITTRRAVRSASPNVANRKGTVHSMSMPRHDDFGYVWMTVPKNYRQSSDDGVLTALLLGPLISAACLYVSYRWQASVPPNSLPLHPGWIIEAPILLNKAPLRYSTLEALTFSRRNLLQQSTFCSFLLFLHLTASRRIEAMYRAEVSTSEGERGSVPRSEARRTWLFIMFTLAVSVIAICVRGLFEMAEIGIWKDLTFFDIALSSLFYQFTLYMAIRLAHRSFTLGELGLVSFGGTVIAMEAAHLTIAKIWPITTPYIKTFRLPTPLLIFQLALIPGSLLIGFLLSPLLYLSRHIAQRPIRKLRFPQEKRIHRRALALGFYVGAAVITGGLIGMWTRWCLGNRDPWLWVIYWIVEGRRPWSRPLLLAYWAALAGISVAGWNRQLSRSRRFRHKYSAQPSDLGDSTSQAAQPRPKTPPAADVGNVPPSPNALGLSFPMPTLPTLPNGANVSIAANDLFDAADKRIPTLGLNARRKFFHALAVVMFVPGIALDPAFTHLSFSVAFALFTFAEYVRYFALYPFGAAVHVFLTEFLDHKDSGTAILSHFYLLTGCAGSLWLESPTRLLEFTGVLVLGIGDAMASIVGKRLGKHRWSPTSSKSLEGSLAFVISVVASAWILRICRVVEPFSTVRYSAAVSFAALLEALSVQNDNLTLPLFLWSIVALAAV